jgi:hypothetical protein
VGRAPRFAVKRPKTLLLSALGRIPLLKGTPSSMRQSQWGSSHRGEGTLGRSRAGCERMGRDRIFGTDVSLFRGLWEPGGVLPRSRRGSAWLPGRGPQAVSARSGG